MLRKLAFVMLASLAPLAAHAGDATSGDIVLHNAWSRATPEGSDVGGGFLTIINRGDAEDRLLSGTTDFADVEVHEMKMEGSVMQMRELTNGLVIPAKGEVKLAPGGYHLMFMNLKHPLNEGDKAHVTLKFERAGDIGVDFDVGKIGASAPAAANQ